MWACKCERELDRHVGSINRLLYQHDGTRPAPQGLNCIESLHLSVHVLQWDTIERNTEKYSTIGIKLHQEKI